MMDTVVFDGEVVLGGYRFPHLGQVKRSVITPFPPKFVIGDYSRDDRVIESSWVVSSFSGGNGILYPVLPRDQDRYWWQRGMGTMHRHLTLGPRVIQAGTLTGPIDFFVLFKDDLYAIKSNTIYRWNETSSTWGSSLKTFSAPANAVVIFQNELYVITESGLHKSANGSTWTDYTSTYVPSGYAMVVWDDKLFRLGTDNVLYWSITPTNSSANWTNAGTLDVPTGSCRQLLVWFDLTGEPAIHAITKDGIYGYEFPAHKFYRTSMTYPVTADAGRGADVWRGELYIPAGANAYQYNGQIIRPVGPNRDDGLPAELRGSIRQMVGGHALLYSIIDAETTDGSTLDDLDLHYGSETWDALPFLSTTTRGAVMATSGVSWHTLAELDGPMGAAWIGSVGETYRLWFSSAAGVYYINTHTGLHNPLQNPTEEYCEAGELLTGWADLGWSEIDKLALAIDVECSQMSEDETVQISIAYDEIDEWVDLGTITQDGKTRIQIGGFEGTLFRRVRFRVRMERGDDPKKTPVLRHMSFQFVRLPEDIYGWEITLPLTEEYEGQSPQQMVDNLYEVLRRKRALAFIYRDADTQELILHRVLVGGMQGAELAGGRREGRYSLSLVELSED